MNVSQNGTVVYFLADIWKSVIAMFNIYRVITA